MAKHKKGGGSKGNSSLLIQPKFDNRIYRLYYPLTPNQGILKRGFMSWRQAISGLGGLAQVHFLYNPSTVEADYALSDPTVGASLLFPNPNDKADLKVPLQQTVSFSILFDRTYELWGSYDIHGKPRHSIGAQKNNPQVVGVMADIMQMQQFTGMTVGYNSKGTPTTAGTKNLFVGKQGILQLIPSYVYFGDATIGLSYYGYISEWTAQVTHWTQFMVPMRCVIDIEFTLLPPVKNTTTSQGQTNWGVFPTPTGAPPPVPIGVQPSSGIGR